MTQKTFSLALDLSEIIYDIQNKTYLTGRSRADGSNHEQVANMQANDDEENAAQILRSIASALGVLTSRLADYIDSDASTASNALLSPEADISLSLRMPRNFNPAALDGIAQSAHAFIVASAVADWFTITDKPDAADYSAAAARWLDSLAAALSRRLRPLRATLSRSLPPIA